MPPERSPTSGQFELLPMLEPIFFRRLLIQAFRGFRDEQTIDLDASAVIIRGPNGTGKTSLFDALQWLLTGKIGRLESLPKRPRDEYIANRYRSGISARVEAEVTLRDGRLVVLRRIGTKSKPILEWEDGGNLLVGSDAEARLEAELTPDPTVSLETALLSSGLLQQDVMREVLEATESERYKHINSLLGLDELTHFEEAARDSANVRAEALDEAQEELNAADAELAEREDELAGLRLRLRNARPVAEARGRLRATCMRVESLVSLSHPLWDADDVSADLEGIRLFRGLVERAISEDGAIRAGLAGLVFPDRADVGSKSQRLEEVEAESARLVASLSSVEAREGLLSARLESLAELARVAIPLLSDHCPVCGQAIDLGDIQRRLLEQSEDAEEVERLLGERERAEEQVVLLRNEGRQIRADLARYAEVEAARAVLRSREDGLAQLVLDIASGVRTPPLSAPSLTTEGGLENVAAHILDAVVSIEDDVVDYSLAREASGEESGARQIAQQIEALKQTRRAREDVVQKLRERHQRAEALARATKEAAVAVVDRRFSSLRPLVRDVYSRLDPHPSFKMLDFQHDFYRARGTSRAVVRDVEAGVEADPVLIFSSSQANIAALSYFLALGWAAGDRTLPFLLLDDPLQSMDDVNVLGFSDLCRFARRQRQLLISTHEDRFASLLERKLAARSEDERTKVLHFVSWDRSGPQIEEADVPGQLVEREARLIVSSTATG